MEEIYASLAPGASNRSKAAVADHISRCRFCFEEFEMLLPLFRQKEKTVGEICRLIAPPPQDRRSRPGRNAWLFAAPALLAASLTLVLVIGHRPSNTETRSRRERGVPARTATLLSPKAGSNCAPSDLTFTWAPQREADYYLFELFDDSLSLLWQSPFLFEPSIVPPPGVVQRLRAGGSYFWMVTSWNSDGEKTESPIGHFTLRQHQNVSSTATRIP
ncbi:MAG: hypothetical protein JW747_04905 [Candidatus Aminicenantes bacterium]|nr:hypothetical protein [Candidatus Aminicenantes bacterium]